MGKHENLVTLRLAYDTLVKAGDDSLRAAFNFGQVIDALSNTFTLKTMGQEIGRTAVTVGTYARLYRRYPTVETLLKTAQEYGTFDISKLVAGEAVLRAKFGYQCNHCGSWDVVHRRHGVKPKLTAVPGGKSVPASRFMSS